MKIGIPVLLSFSFFVGAMQSEWQNYKIELVSALQKGSAEQAVEKRILIPTKNQVDQTINNIMWALRKKGAGPTLVAVYVYEGGEEHRAAFVNPNNPSYRALNEFMVELARKRFAPGPEKGAIAAVSGPSVQAVDPNIIIVSYQNGAPDPKKSKEEDKAFKAKILADFISSLPVLYGQTTKTVVVAKGESTDIVSRATHRMGSVLDTLIYFQAPIYEWEWIGQYVYNTDLAPVGFQHLYHFYSKSGWSPRPTNPERKFKQQASVNNTQVKMPVKNVRMLKVTDSKKLQDFSDNDFLSTQAIRNFSHLFEKIDEYRINFDLLAQGLIEGGPQASAVAVNRFVTLNSNVISASYGSSALAQEKWYTVAELSPAQLAWVKKEFAAEVRLSNQQIDQIMKFPASQGWVSFLSGGFVSQLELSQDLKNIQERNRAELKKISP